MKLPAAKLIATIVCSLSMLGTAAAPTEACCFLSSLFGCCSPRYGACYSPSRCSPCGPSGCSTYYSPGCSTGSCGSTAYYSPGCSSCYSSTCAPCGTGCSPCGSSCANGDCAVSSASPSSVAPPVADPNWRKKTYVDPENGSGSSSGSSSGSTPAGSGSNGSGSSGSSGGTRTKPEGFRTDEEDSTSFKPPTNGDIQQTGGEESGESVPVRPKGKKSPEAPSIPADDEAGSGAGHLPTLNLDEKVAWRSAPERKRITLKVRTANARLVRVPEYPKSEWTPVEPESKVAKK